MKEKEKSLADEIKRTKPFEILEEEAYLNLMRTASMLSRPVKALFQKYGITEAQFNVLRILMGAPQGQLPSESIGQRLVARSPDVTQLIDRLQRKSLVERNRSRDDRRVVKVQITPQGRDLVRVLNPQVERLLPDLFSHMEPADLALLNAFLVQVRSSAKVEPLNS